MKATRKIQGVLLFLLLLFLGLFLACGHIYAGGGFYPESTPIGIYDQGVEPPKQDNQIGLDISFLSDIIAIEIAVVAFLIPLAVDMISRLSDRYDSEVVVLSFKNENVYRVFPYFLVTNILAVCAVKVFSLSSVIFIRYGIFLSGVITNFWIILLLRKIEGYLIGTDYIKRKLYEKARKTLE